MSTPAQLFAAFFILCAAGAALAFLVPRRGLPMLLAAVGSLAALIVLTMSAMLLLTDAEFHAALWPVLSLGTLTLGCDRLSAFFLFVTGLVYLPVSMFSGAYLKKYVDHYSLRYFSVLYHALFAAIVLVLIADDVISFLVAWEVMSIAKLSPRQFRIRARRKLAGRLRHAGDERGGYHCSGDRVHADRRSRGRA